MQTRSRIGTISFFIFVAVSILFVSCKKEDDLIIAPITFNPTINYGSMTDQEGNTYKTVIVGTQTWMAENLKVTKYRNGDLVPNVTDSAKWRGMTTGGYCFYDNDNRYFEVYGCLYNWYAVSDSRNLAPVGWHIPSEMEWATLNNFLGGNNIAGYKLEEAGNTHWQPFSYNTNESGFTALPGGIRINSSFFTMSLPTTYSSLGLNCFFWTSTEESSTRGYYDFIELEFSNRKGSSKYGGLSVRCIKD